MRLLVLSDLHMEHAPFVPRKDGYDVAVLAGDIDTGVKGIQWALAHFTTPVVFVPGNHESWGGARWEDTVSAMAALAAGTNVHFLHRDSVDIQGVRFHGATLWTDYNALSDQPLAMVRALGSINDHKEILHGDGRWLPEHALEAHELDRAFLANAFNSPRNKQVVVTHHPPSVLSVADNRRDDQLVSAYASRLENMVAYSGTALWIHGHTHHSVDYTLGATRVLSNPRGYGRDADDNGNAAFDPNLVVEI